ncbi:hypothetical protein [Alsobacter sp. SYSU BS001988]
MNESDAVLAVKGWMDGTERNAGTPDAIAQIMAKPGYQIRDLDEVDRREA